MHGNRLLLMAALVVIGLTTAAHGIVTNRWNGGAAAPVLPDIPLQFGNWNGEDQHSDFAEPGIAHLSRRYVHSASGRTFVIALTIGHPGLTAIHTPEYCYTGSGYEMTTPIARRAVEGGDQPRAEFFTTVFQKPGTAAGESLRLFWTWSADGQWKAPTHPRLAFLGKPTLCKLYVVAAGGVDPSPGRDPQLDEFLAGLRDSLNGALFSRR